LLASLCHLGLTWVSWPRLALRGRPVLSALPTHDFNTFTLSQNPFSPPTAPVTQSAHAPTLWARRSWVILALLALPVFWHLTSMNIQAKAGWFLILRPPAIGLLLLSLPLAVASLTQFVATKFLGYTDKNVFWRTVAISCWPLIGLLLIFGAGLLLTEVAPG